MTTPGKLMEAIALLKEAHRVARINRADKLAAEIAAFVLSVTGETL